MKLNKILNNDVFEVKKFKNQSIYVFKLTRVIIE